MERKPTLAFVDNIFHQRTMSSDFFKKLIAAHFELINFWDRTSQKGPRIDTDTINRHEYVVFWQRLNTIAELEKITSKIIWVPMFDSISFDYLFWKNLSLLPIKVLCFSKAIYNQCLKFGIESLYVQYFSEPKWKNDDFATRAKTLFFWNRGAVSFEMVKKIIDPSSIEQLIYLSRPDPNYKTENLTPEDKEKFKIRVIEMDFKESRTEYFDLVHKSGIYVAPRKKEGIGLSFIEAIGYGSVVLAYNDGTMNEYIRHGYNGYLFDENTKEVLDFSSLSEISKNSRRVAEEGYKKWLEGEKLAVAFVKTKASSKNRAITGVFWKKLYALKLWQFKMRMKYF